MKNWDKLTLTKQELKDTIDSMPDDFRGMLLTSERYWALTDTNRELEDALLDLCEAVGLVFIDCAKGRNCEYAKNLCIPELDKAVELRGKTRDYKINRADKIFGKKDQ